MGWAEWPTLPALNTSFFTTMQLVGVLLLPREGVLAYSTIYPFTVVYTLVERNVVRVGARNWPLKVAKSIHLLLSQLMGC